MALDGLGGQQDTGGLFLPDGSQYMTQQLSTIPSPDATPAGPAVAGAPAATPGLEATGAPAAPGAAPVDAPDPNLEISRRLEGISKKEARARRAEQELHEQRATFAEDQKKMAAKLAELDDALGDPVKHLLKIGKDPVDIARRYATPETELEKEVRLIKEERATEKEANEQQAKEYEDRQRETNRMAVVRDFVKGINEKDHPNFVAMYPDPNEVPEMVSKLLNSRMDPRDSRSPTVLQHFKDTHDGRSPTDDEIRESLESEAETRATSLIKRHQARLASQAPGQSQVPANAENGPSGISNQHASVTTAGKKRPPTLEEKRRIARKELTEALEAEATDRD